MKRFIILAAIAALALARPELYKEQEDFQYSRSSSDDGKKAGHYGAQRGNMGGNFERSHNMDLLAQNQMSGLVRQVEGELGDGANTRAGNVYTAANSKGIYGSGHFDLSNLAGRNFQEGSYVDSSNAQSRSSLSQTSSAHSADYSNSNSHSYSNSRYRGYQKSDAQTQTDDMQSLDNSQANQYYNYGKHSSGYQSQAGFQEHGEYDHSNDNLRSGSNIRTRLVSATPVRVVLTPGGRVAIPVVAQTYDATQGLSGFEQNAVNHDSLALSENNQDYTPSNAKHYESSYRYHKKWEKHDTIPTSISVVLPTEAPIPKNSELLEDREATQQNLNSRGFNLQSEHSSSASGRYSGTKSSSSQSGYQSNYNNQYHGDSSSSNANLYNPFGYRTGSLHDSSSAAKLNANSQTDYNSVSSSDLNSQVENLNTKPKTYQSSYSYHKSWERQGDPYVIKPASGAQYDSQGSQRLSNNQRYTGYNSGSHYSQHQDDCDENGHIRIARSSYTDNRDMQQQNQNLGDGNQLAQQVQRTWQNSEDLSQQSQGDWDPQNVGQQSQSQWENLEDLNQQSQNNWSPQQSLNLEQSNVEQQSQNKWNNFEDLGQQSQPNWEQQSGGQQTQNQNLEELGQQSQSNWEQQNVGQESQNKWDTFENLGYQSNKNWGGQTIDQNRMSKVDDITQQHQTSHTNSENPNFRGEHNQDIKNQQTQQFSLNKAPEEIEEHQVAHKVETPWDKFDILDANNKNKSTVEHKAENSEFYWHHIPNNGVEDQQINKLNANGDIITDIESNHRNLNTNPISEQAHEYVGVDNNYYNPNVHYSYSNGFVNPTIYNKRDFNPDYQNSHQVSSGNTHSWNAEAHNRDVNINSQVNNSQIYSQDSKISSIWNKIDNIETASNFSSLYDNLSTESEKNVSVSDSNGSGETTYDLTNLSQTNNQFTRNISSETQMTPKTELKPDLSKNYKFSGNDISDLPKEIESSSTNEPETLHDIGRGDIGTDDFYNTTDVIPMSTDVIPMSTDVIKILPESHTMTNTLTRDNTAEVVESNTDNNNKSFDTELNILSLEQQKEKKLFNISDAHIFNMTRTSSYNKTNTSVENGNDSWQLSNTNKSQNISNISDTIQQNEEKQTTLQNELGHDLREINQQDQDSKLQNRDTKLKDVATFEQESINLEKEEQNLQNSIQQNLQHLAQQNFNNFKSENSQEIMQQNVNFEQNSQNIEQVFVEEDQNLEQHYFEQQNLQGFVQQNENSDDQNLQNFEQVDVQDFAQENQNLEQQSLYNFGQDLRDLGHHSENQGQQTLNNFGQENLQTSDQKLENEFNQFEQNIQNVEQENENQHIDKPIVPNQSEQNIQNFGQINENRDSPVVPHQFEQNIQQFEQENENQHNLQQDAHNFRLQNEQNARENFNDFDQHNIPNFRIQKQSGEQQNHRNIDNQNENTENPAQINKLHQQEDKEEPVLPEIVEEPVVEKEIPNLQQSQTDLGENFEKKNVEGVSTVIEKATESPGFWKSLGKKLSNAKNKVVTWFKS